MPSNSSKEKQSLLDEANSLLLQDEEDHAPLSSRRRCPNQSLRKFAFAFSLLASLCIGALFGQQFATRYQPMNPNIEYSNAQVPLDVDRHVFAYNQSFGTDPYSNPQSRPLWDSIVPLGRGTVEYPPGSRKYSTISAVHQLHCLWSMHQVLFSVSRGDAVVDDYPHIRHCFDYLRQSLMCASDTTLEPVDTNLGGVTGWDVSRSCRNYEQLKDWAKAHRASNERGFGDHH